MIELIAFADFIRSIAMFRDAKVGQRQKMQQATSVLSRGGFEKMMWCRCVMYGTADDSQMIDLGEA